MVLSLPEPHDDETPYLAMLHRISSVVSSDLCIDEMLGEVIGLTVQVTGCDACLVYLIEHGTSELVLRGSQVPHAGDLGSLRIKIGEGITGWVAEHRSPVVLPSHAPLDSRFKHVRQLVEDTYQAFLSVPLVSGGESIGIINVHHREPHDYTAGEISLVSFIGEQMGNALAKSLLVEENERLEREAIEVRSQLEARKVIERAKGILQRCEDISEQEAYQRLRDQSRRLKRPIKELAEAIILTDDLGRM